MTADDGGCLPQHPLIVLCVCLCVYALMRSTNERGAILPCNVENSRRWLNKARQNVYGLLFVGCVATSSDPWLFFTTGLGSPLTLGNEIPLVPSRVPSSENEAVDEDDGTDPSITAGGLHPVMFTSSLMQWALVYTRAVHIARLLEHALDAVLSYRETGSAFPKGGHFKSLYGVSTFRRLCSCLVLISTICCPVMPLVVLKDICELAVAKLLHLILYYTAERGLGVSRDGLNYCRFLSATRALVDIHFLSKTVQIGVLMRRRVVWAMLAPEIVNYFCTDHRCVLCALCVRARARVCACV